MARLQQGFLARWRVLSGVFVALAAVAVVLGFQIGRPQAQTPPPGTGLEALPSVKVVRGTAITPANAFTWYDQQAQTVTDGLCTDYASNSQLCPGGVRPRAPEIKELARALRYDPNLFYEFIRNDVDTEFLFGAHKGPLGVVIDRSGTAFDQAELLVELFKEAQAVTGVTYNARYVVGTVTLSGAEFQQWTGITNAQAATDFLATGGIPVSVTASGSNVGSIQLAHAWVEADIGGSTRFFDPAFKSYDHKTGLIDVRTEMGFAAHGVADAAGGGDQATGTTDLTVLMPVDQNSAFGMNAKLASYSQNLLTRLNGSDLAGADLSDVIGGRTIQPATRPSGGWLVSRPSNYVLAHSFTALPDVYRAQIKLHAESPAVAATQTTPAIPAVVYVDARFFADEIYGRRAELTGMTSTPTSTTATWAPALKFDGVTLAIGQALPNPYRLGLDLYITADHPFAGKEAFDSQAKTYNAGAWSTAYNVDGKYGDISVKKVVDLFHPAELVVAWGDTSPDLLRKWEAEQVFDTTGYITVSSPLADEQPQASGSGDMLRARIAATWLSQFTLAANINAQLANARPVLLHTLGIVSSDQQTVAIPPPPHDPGDITAGDTTGSVSYDEVTIVDLESSFGVVTRTNDANDPITRTSDAVGRRAAVQAIATAAAALEGSVVAQLSDTPDATSTAARLAWGNNPESGETANTGGRPVYRFQTYNSTGGAFSLATYEGGTGPVAADTAHDVPAIAQTQVDLTRGQLSKTVQAYAQAGFDVVASSEASLGPGGRIGSEYADFTYQITRGSSGNTYTEFRTCVSGPVPQSYNRWTEWNSSINPSQYSGGTSQIPGTYDCNVTDPNSSLMNGHFEYDPFGSVSVGDTFTRTITSYSRLPTIQRGGALIATRYDGTSDEPLEIANVLTRYGAPTKGGGGPSVSQFQAYNPSEAAQSLKDRFVDRSAAQGVDLAAGRAGWVSGVLASVGQGDFPYRLERRVELRGGAVSGVPLYLEEQQTAYSTFEGGTGGPVSNWQIKGDISNSGFEAMGQSRIQAAVPTLVAFVAIQDTYAQLVKSAKREVVGALTAKWWADRLLFNVVTVMQGASAQQFVRLTDNSFLPVSGGAAKLTMTGDRSVLRPNIEKQRLAGATQTLATLRGWKYNNVAFVLTGANGDKQTFQYWTSEQHLYPPNQNPQYVDGQHGWRMNTWTFPQGVTLTMDYKSYATSGAAIPSDIPIKVSSNLGYHLDLADTDSTNLVPPTDPASPNLVFQVADAAGSIYKVSLRPPQARSPTQRPDPNYRPYEVFAPDNLNSPAVRYAYDSLGRVKEARDAVSVQEGTRGPHQFFIVEGYRGERQDPQAAKATRLDKPGVASPGLYTVEWLQGGRTTRTTDEDGRVVTTTLDGRGRVLTRTFPENDKVLFEYDSRDNVTKLTKCPKTGCNATDNLVVTATWETTWNKLATITDPMGRVTYLHYYDPNTNGASLIKDVARPSPDGTTNLPTYGFEYNGFGQLTRSYDPDWVDTVVNTYDPNNFLATTRTGPASLNLVTTFVNDTQGNVTDSWDVRGQSISGVHTDYDLMRRPTMVTAPLGAVTKTTYDAAGRPTKVEKRLWDGTTETWQTYRTGYTPTGQTAWTSDPSNDVTTFEYDELDRKVKMTGPAGDVSAWTYDLASQLLKEKRAVGITASPGEQDYVTWAYTPNGQKASITDARGNTSTFVYDGFDRQLRTVFPDGTWEGSATNAGFTDPAMYNKAGDLLRARTREGHFVVKTYDNLDRPITQAATLADGVTPAINSESWRMRPSAYVYSWAGRLKEANTDELLQSWVYDTAGRPSDHYDGSVAAGKHFAYGYNPTAGQTSLTYPGGLLVATFTNDGLGRLTNVATTGVASASASIAYDTLSRRTLLTFGDGSSQAYAYEPDDDLSSISHVFPGRTTDNASFTWTYDKAGRQISETVSNSAYVLSPANLAQVYAAASGVNTYPTVGGTPYTYDTAGMMTSDGVRNYQYDEAGHQTRTSLVSDASTYAVDRYDALGQRFFHYRGIPAAADPERTEYTDGIRPEIVWEEIRSTAEGAGAPTTTNQRYFVLGPNPDEHLIYIDKPSGAAVVRYPHTTRRGDVIAVAKLGLAEAKFKYGAFGETTDAPGTVYSFRFTGQRLDDWTGLYHFKARAYSPTLGRFLQPDPLQYQVGPNLYAYCGNDPYNCADPSGLFDDSLFNWNAYKDHDRLILQNLGSVKINGVYFFGAHGNATGIYGKGKPTEGQRGMGGWGDPVGVDTVLRAYPKGSGLPILLFVCNIGTNQNSDSFVKQLSAKAGAVVYATPGRAVTQEIRPGVVRITTEPINENGDTGQYNTGFVAVGRGRKPYGDEITSVVVDNNTGMTTVNYNVSILGLADIKRSKTYCSNPKKCGS